MVMHYCALIQSLRERFGKRSLTIVDLFAGEGHCLISDENPTAEWWVDLKSILSVHRIIIRYRTDDHSWGNKKTLRFRFAVSSMILLVVTSDTS